MRPASAPRLASTARQLPSPAAVTNRKAVSSSTMVWRGLPQSKCWPKPLAKLWNPAATADRCSASSRDRSDDAPIASPSLDKITALSTFATLVTRSSSSQSRLPVAVIGVLPLLLLVPLLLPPPQARSACRKSLLLSIRFVGHLLGHRTAALPAALQCGHRASRGLGGRLPGGSVGSCRAGSHLRCRDKARCLLRSKRLSGGSRFAKLRRQVGLPHPHRQFV